MTDAMERFLARLDVGDCWEWRPPLIPSGYGQFFPGDGRRWRAHRWLWTQLVGGIADGYELDHLCRNRACVNPDHLEPVSRRTNQRRGFSPPGINSRKTHCSQGHEYTDENTWNWVDRNGTRKRRCKKCENAKKNREYWAKKNRAGADQ